MSDQSSDTVWPSQDGVKYALVVGCHGYCVGDNGSVWTRRIGGRAGGRLGDKWRKMAFSRKSTGYLTVSLFRDDGSRRTKLVHHVVLEAFIGPRQPDCEACHYPDKDKSNNALCNLRWGTHADNGQDHYRGRKGKICWRCKTFKMMEEYYRSPIHDGRQYCCKSCCSEMSKGKPNTESNRASCRRNYRNHVANGWRRLRRNGKSFWVRVENPPK